MKKPGNSMYLPSTTIGSKSLLFDKTVISTEKYLKGKIIVGYGMSGSLGGNIPFAETYAKENNSPFVME